MKKKEWGEDERESKKGSFEREYKDIKSEWEREREEGGERERGRKGEREKEGGSGKVREREDGGEWERVWESEKKKGKSKRGRKHKMREWERKR